jgi:hypothetical protein
VTRVYLDHAHVGLPHPAATRVDPSFVRCATCADHTYKGAEMDVVESFGVPHVQPGAKGLSRELGRRRRPRGATRRVPDAGAAKRQRERDDRGSTATEQLIEARARVNSRQN